MKLNRDITTKIHYIFDHILPPILRDSKIFMFLVFCAVYGRKNAVFFLNFKKNAPFFSEREFEYFYSNNINSKLINNRDTDLNKACLKEIVENIKGSSVLEVGCGKCFLSNELEKRGYSVCSVDLHISNITKNKYPNLKFKNENIERLSFSNKVFDTVICTHTLEHVLNISQAILELKRVTKKRLIIVVPKQRSYKYTFDLHLHFFPYLYSFLQIMKPKQNRYICKIISGDIFYTEDFD
jgi:ubiquinone/menaquinone biosynthesis C-methylase UbiE